MKNKTDIVNQQRSVTLTRRQKELIGKTVDAVTEFEGITVKCEVAVTLINNKKIQKLNKEFRNIDSSTDVLSFPSGEYPPHGEESCYLGDIAINLERAQVQCMEYGHSFERELAFLTAHSVLHLLGYDHMTEADEVVMFAKQEAILSGMDLVR